MKQIPQWEIVAIDIFWGGCAAVAFFGFLYALDLWLVHE